MKLEMKSTAAAHTLGPFIIISFLHPLENRVEAQKSRATCLRSHSLSIGRIFRPSYPWLAFSVKALPWLAFSVKALPWLLGHRQLAHPKLKFHLQQVFPGECSPEPSAIYTALFPSPGSSASTRRESAACCSVQSAAHSSIRGAEHGTWHSFCGSNEPADTPIGSLTVAVSPVWCVRQFGKDHTHSLSPHSSLHEQMCHPSG